MPWEIRENEGEYCVHKKTGEKIACHTSREAAEKQMRALYANEHMEADALFLIDNFVVVKPGEPFRLFPFGTLVKNGKKRDITPEYARSFRLPHFKPPIKLGSHDETTPAGGHIAGLEVRDDGLYAIPEITEKGARALDEGDYRYHSPEILFDGGFEDPVTGEIIPAPLIVGDALLHTPHLGEAAALYSVTPFDKENTMSESVQIPTSLWEKFLAKLFPAPADEPTPPDPQPPVEAPKADEFAAVAAERDQYKAEIERAKAETAKAELLASIKAEFAQEEFGATYIELGKAEEAHEMMMGMTPEQREWCMRNFKAMSKQIATNDALTREIGSDKPTDNSDPRTVLDNAIKARVAEKGVDYLTAYTQLKAEQPELFKA